MRVQPSIRDDAAMVTEQATKIVDDAEARFALLELK
jgi:hypothetical protein